MTDLHAILPELCREIHASNVKAGWWSDLATGDSILATRNRPEMLMLAVSELAEAKLGVFGQADDKLPHLPMYDVELADFVIRQLDQIGAEVSMGQEMPDWLPPQGMSDLDQDSRDMMRAVSRVDRLMLLVTVVAAAMEHCRKGRVSNYVRSMAEGVLLAFVIAEIEHIDLLDIIAQKRAFNATRADHKVENRVQDGGKRF